MLHAAQAAPTFVMRLDSIVSITSGDAIKQEFCYNKDGTTAAIIWSIRMQDCYGANVWEQDEKLCFRYDNEGREIQRILYADDEHVWQPNQKWTTIYDGEQKKYTVWSYWTDNETWKDIKMGNTPDDTTGAHAEYTYDSLGRQVKYEIHYDGIHKIHTAEYNDAGLLSVLHEHDIVDNTELHHYFAYDHHGNLLQESIYDVVDDREQWMQTISYVYDISICAAEVMGYTIQQTDFLKLSAYHHSFSHPLAYRIVHDRSYVTPEIMQFYYSHLRTTE